VTRSRRTTIVLALLAFVLGFGGATATLDITQPTNVDSTAVVQFEVAPGDGISTVAGHLQQAGLVRSGLLFGLLARLRHLDGHPQPGIYRLSPGMSMGDIIQRLQEGNPDAPAIAVPPGKKLVVVPPGLRVTQYPSLFANLPSFDAKRFLATATTGVLPDGKRASDLFWYVAPKQPGTFFALEGYLPPGIYFFNPGDDDVVAIKQMLTALGERLCPGPDAAHPDAYLADRAQCEAHAAKVGTKPASIFAAMEQRYFTNDDVRALYDTLIVSSLVVRISAFDDDASGIAGVYYNRYRASRGNPYAPSGDFVAYFDSPATAQYARDTKTPPPGGDWWEPLAGPGATIATDSAYNTTVPDNRGLLPGPIAAPTWADVVAAATAGDPAASPNYYVIADRCGHPHYAASLAQFLVVSQQASLGC
jgi:cell division protein YceG involved in septum cleavage